MKPIEKGCRAVIIKSMAGNEWKEVTVGDCIGVLINYSVPEPRWEISPSLISNTGDLINHMYESWLMRIDGYDQEETREMEKEYE